MLFIFLLVSSLCVSQHCEACKTFVGEGLELSRKGVPLQKVNSTLLSECRKQKNPFAKMTCQLYVKKYIVKLYKNANDTSLTPLSICEQFKVCSTDDL